MSINATKYISTTILFRWDAFVELTKDIHSRTSIHDPLNLLFFIQIMLGRLWATYSFIVAFVSF